MKNQDHNITSYVEEIKNTQRSPHNPPKLFSIIPKCESKLSRAMNWVAWWQEQESGVKFQQHNSSSKNGEENE
jgi:hypothetical protein